MLVDIRTYRIIKDRQRRLAKFSSIVNVSQEYSSCGKWMDFFQKRSNQAVLLVNILREFQSIQNQISGRQRVSKLCKNNFLATVVNYLNKGRDIDRLPLIWTVGVFVFAVI